MVLIVTYGKDDTQLAIEGFGPETIIGAIRDILSGNYGGAPSGAMPSKLEIGHSVKATQPFQLDTSKPLGPPY